MIYGVDSLCPNAGISQPILRIRRTFAGVALDGHGASPVGLLFPCGLDLPLARAVTLHEAVAVDFGALLLGENLGADLQF